MSGNICFEKSYCLLYKNNTDIQQCLSNIGLSVEYIQSSVINSFESYIEIFKNALNAKYSHIIIFNDNILQINQFDDNLNHILQELQNSDIDLIILSKDIFQNPTTGAIIYKNRSFQKIIDDCHDYIDIMNYELYLFKYSKLNIHITDPCFFYTDTVLQRLLVNCDIYHFIWKYYFLFIFCIFSFYVKKYIKNIIVRDIGKRNKGIL
jgi:hypothetical protein